MLIGIVGGPSSGKTSVAMSLGKQVISQEGYYSALRDGEDEDQVNWDDPSRLDYDLYLNDLQSLKDGHGVCVPIFDKVEHNITGWVKIKGNDRVIVEGIFVGSTQKERDLFDMLIFIDVEPDIRLVRRLRNSCADNIGAVLNEWEQFVIPGYEKYTLPIKKYVDLVVPRGSQNTIAMDIIRSYLQTL